MGKFARDGVENRTLPVYPAGMLLEPFVQKLASEMSDSIDNALQNVYSDGTFRNSELQNPGRQVDNQMIIPSPTTHY